MTRQHADFTEETITSKTVYHGRLLHVLEDLVRLPDGTRATREYIRHPGAVMMVPVLDADTVLLVHQYRYALRRHFYELPAGKREAGEDPLATARRELREECGYEAAQWQHLTSIHPCIGYSDEAIELYLARDLTHVGQSTDDEEFVEVVPLRLADALQWVRDGRITEVKAIIGLLWVERVLRGA